MLAKTPMVQCSPCYSTVSALLMNPLPDRSNYLPLLPHPLPHSPINTSLVSSGNTLYQAAPLETNKSGTQEKPSALRKLNNKQRQVLMFLILLFKLLTQFPLSLFSLSLSSLCSFSQSSLFSLSTIPSFINYLSF